VQQIYPHRALDPVHSFRRAVQASAPQLIVPADDLATHLLHDVYRLERKQHPEGSELASLIERSLGAAESFPLVEGRAAFLARAKTLRIRAPQTIEVSDVKSLANVASELGYPFVLKADGTSGGYGVRIVHSAEEARSAFRALHAPPLFARAVKRAVMDHDRNLLIPALTRRIPAINAQAFVEGSDATSTVACWNGKVLAGLHFEVIRKRYELGPASVMQWIENTEMQDAVVNIVANLKLSGIHGFDFVLETGTTHAHLIEINPRTTQVGHINLGAGRDLPGALSAAVSGSEPVHTAAVSASDVVALFPQEWMRDPGSTFIEDAYHDVPWAEPDLLEMCIERAQKQFPRKSGTPVARATAEGFSPGFVDEHGKPGSISPQAARLANSDASENLPSVRVTRG
jgi:hypothetical protein